MKRNSQQGVALVITLILLSVITFMAVTFLVVSRHEGAQVNTLTQQSTAKYAADDALEQAKALIAAKMLAGTNGLNFNLVVSTNFINPAYYNGNRSLTNVSYNLPTGATPTDLQTMLNNLLIIPRAPVFIFSNKSQTIGEFRYYLDLNRNGVYDTNGPVVEQDANGNIVVNSYVGDPEWIGILNHPDQRHSASNQFVGRYCFIALPIGNSLDVNYIHNQSKLLAGNPWQNGYLRDQGVGSWEINLAAFLHELNTNWDAAFVPYGYATNNGAGAIASTGTSFDDATAILQYRYNNNYTSLRSFSSIFQNPAQSRFITDFIDGYNYGPLMTTYSSPTVDPDKPLIVRGSPWCGDDSVNQYFTTQDLFNRVPFPQGLAANANLSFSNRLFTIGRSYNGLINNYKNSITNSYNRYTFYRMLSQMGFGSAPEPVPYSYANDNTPFPAPKLNLNYNNVTSPATNYSPWTDAAQFFTNAADRMLRATFANQIVSSYALANGNIAQFAVSNLSITNIPIFPVNCYTPAVHRIMQLAANIYDASTNRPFSLAAADINGPYYYPSVFRPRLAMKITGGVTNIYINGYDEITNYQQVMQAPYDIRRPTDFSALVNAIQAQPTGATNNVYGVPLVVGARKGFPNFNQFSVAPIVQISRKMQIVKDSFNNLIGTNVQYIVGISNVTAVQCWNSYATSYGRGVTIIATNEMTMVLTNQYGHMASNNFVVGANQFYASNAPNGFGSMNKSGFIKSIVVPFNAGNILLSNSVMVESPRYFDTNTARPFENPSGFTSPQWILNVTNRLRVMMIDQATGRLIDYVQLSGLDSNRNLTMDLAPVVPSQNQEYTNIWGTNTTGATYNPTHPTYGMLSQIAISENANLGAGFWVSAGLNPQSMQDAVYNFNLWINNQASTNAGLRAQVPFTPTAKLPEYMAWQANDPLVHYMASDLVDLTQTTPRPIWYGDPTQPPGVLTNIYKPSTRYQPWSSFQNDLSSTTKFNLAFKDPQINGSDSWLFPSNKFPNVGWLGRVHRGTPWQTVYLKSPGVGIADWTTWTGDAISNSFFGPQYPVSDAQISIPSSDWMLMDLFTAAPNDNASRGQLSVNQTSTAAWAAVLDGVLVLKNTSTGLVATNIDPYQAVNGTNMVQYFVNAINNVRAGNTNTGGNFTSAGQLFSVPQLTVQSPYLNLQANTNLLRDEVYERIPQQILGLVRLGSPRYVVFAYGQSLKPADHSIVQNGPFFGMCTNYQITGEVATRTVVRFDSAPVPGPGRRPTTPRAVVENFNTLGPE